MPLSTLDHEWVRQGPRAAPFPADDLAAPWVETGVQSPQPGAQGVLLLGPLLGHGLAQASDMAWGRVGLSLASMQSYT